MEQALQISLLKTLLHRLEHGENHDAGCQVVNPATVYTAPDLAQREWQTFFLDHPQIIGLSGDLPAPGHYLALEDFGVPILAVRDESGRFRAFVNACRHRGSQLVPPGRGTATRFVCPFHGWMYRATGELAGITEPAQFGAIDRTCLGLVELPAAEHCGLLFVHPQPGAALEVSSLLGGLEAELASWDLGRQRFTGQNEVKTRMNWKLANDTFGETYHFKRLHRDTVDHIAEGDVATYHIFGRNHRFVFPTKAMAKLRTKPEARWRIGGSTTVLYYLFPNIQLAVTDRQITLFRIYPEGADPTRSATQISHYFTEEALAGLAAGNKTIIDHRNIYDPAARDGNAILSFEGLMEIINSTLEQQDYRMAEATQRTAASGRIPEFIFGRNEAPLHHFHNTFRAALDLPPLRQR